MLRNQFDERANLWDGPLAFLALAIIVVAFWSMPGTLLNKTDWAAYAVCHRIGSHSYFIAGHQLPLCARCSGTYLGALAGFTVLALRGRGRALRLPARRYLAVLSLFLVLWAFDGVNSYLTLFPGLPHLYEPHNLLRLITGTLEGLAIASLMLPVVNLSLWQNGDLAPSIDGWRDLAWLLVGGALVVFLVNSEWAPLLYPLALLSAIMVVVLVGALNLLVLLLVLRRDAMARVWQQLLAPALVSAGLAVLELGAIDAGRALLTVRLGLWF